MSDRRILLAIVGIVCIAFCLPGCANDPEQGVTDFADSDIEWPTLHEREDLIETILLCYENFDKASLEELGHFYGNVLYDDASDDNDYVWMMDARDVADGHPALLTRAQDINATKNIFSRASELELFISPHQWIEASDICAGCWETTRVYSIVMVTGTGDEAKYMASGEMNIRFIAGPHHDDSGKWAIHVACDLGKIQ
ncbi:MAG: hypothetical protein KAV42_01625 [Candidatus Krumholzibacteria bacterium]|nr:hypothetical protein [Candidatus Krumholzibacteria bacterium]